MSVVVNVVDGKEYIQVRYRDEYGKERRKGGFKTKKKAEDWDKQNKLKVQAKKMALKQAGAMSTAEAYHRLTGVPAQVADSIIKASDATDASTARNVGGNLNAWIDAFIKASQKGRQGDFPVRASTLRSYEGFFKYVRDKFGSRDPELIVTRDFETLRDDLLNKDLSRTTIKGCMRCSKTLFNWLIYKGVYKRANPLIGVKVAVDSGRNDDSRSITKDEIHSTEAMNKILAVLDDRVINGRPLNNVQDALKVDLRTRAFIFVCVFCGLRNGEARALQWKHIDLDTRIIQVAQSADAVTQKVGEVKTKNGDRHVALPTRAANALREWGRYTNMNPGDFVFVRDDGEMMTYSGSKSCWKSAQDGAGVEHKKVHSMRHYYASKLIDANYHEHTISRMLGHASVEFTRRVYVHLLERRKREMTDAEMIDAVFESPPAAQAA